MVRRSSPGSLGAGQPGTAIVDGSPPAHAERWTSVEGESSVGCAQGIFDRASIDQSAAGKPLEVVPLVHFYSRRWLIRKCTKLFMEVPRAHDPQLSGAYAQNP